MNLLNIHVVFCKHDVGGAGGRRCPSKINQMSESSALVQMLQGQKFIYSFVRSFTHSCMNKITAGFTFVFGIS